MENTELIDYLVSSVKDKAELRGMDEKYVKDRVLEHLEEHPDLAIAYEKCVNEKQFLKSYEYTEFIKEVRAILREVYGMFITNNYSKIAKLVDKVIEDPSEENHKKLLESNRSSKERLDSYGKVYQEIFKRTGEPKKILDLACGLNPFSYYYLGCEPEYLCSDISPLLCDLMQKYFDAEEIKGTAFVFDLLQFEKTEMTQYAEADVCFLFKALDSIEAINRDFSEKIIQGIPAKYLVVSFARFSLGGKKVIASHNRTWFEKILEKQGKKWDLFLTENEMYYIVNQNPIV